MSYTELEEFPSDFERDPDFGHDPWLNEATKPPEGQDHEQLFQQLIVMRAVKVFSGADAFQVATLPGGLDAYMSYVDGFGGWNALVQRFGAQFSGLLLSITVHPGGRPARCADVEPRAMSNGELPHWLDHVALTDGGKQLPWVYTSASNFQAANAAIGARHVVRWSAHYGHGPHICGPHTCGYPQADWTQWTDGATFDRSIGTYMPQKPAPPPPPAPKPQKKASGVFNASLSYDHDAGKLTVKGTPGHVKQWADHEVWAEWKIGVCLGGPHKGAWRGNALPSENK